MLIAKATQNLIELQNSAPNFFNASRTRSLYVTFSAIPFSLGLAEYRDWILLVKQTICFEYARSRIRMGPVESRITFVMNSASSERTTNAAPNTDRQFSLSALTEVENAHIRSKQVSPVEKGIEDGQYHHLREPD